MGRAELRTFCEAVARAPRLGVSQATRDGFSTKNFDEPPFYIAPEVRKGAEESAASDYYSLGIMLLRLLTRVWYTPGAKLEEMLLPLDPRWRTIIPGLLAERPEDRVCKHWDRERKNLRVLAGEAKLNEMYLRIRFPHWIIGSVMVIAVVAYVGLAMFAAYQHGKLKMAEREIERLNQVIKAAQ